MTSATDIIKNLKRPGLLIAAVRAGLAGYHRERDLRRILGRDRPLRPSAAFDRLCHEEEMLNDARKEGDAAYRAGRHIEVLVAMVAEARLLSRGRVPGG